MESANHSHLQDHHQLHAAAADDHHSSSSNSLATTPSAWYGTAAASNNNHAWTPNSISTLNTSNQLYQNLNEDPYISTVYSSHNNKDQDMPSPHYSNNHHQHHPLIRDVSYNWTSNTSSSNNNVVESLHLGKTETEEIQHLFPKFTDMMMMNTSSSNNMQKDWSDEDLSEKLLLKTLTSSSASSSFRQYQFPGLEFSMPSRMNFSSPVLPSVNVSSLNQSSSGCSLDMNLQALDFLASARLSGTSVQPSHDDLGLEDERHSLFSQQHQKCSPSHSLLSPFINGAPDEKRSSNNITEPKESQSAPKKSRLEPICRKPLKVRKEKLGDRITALQQLVAPFGKTDTASVLMEAIGYIKFLQNQVETLSVPYMKKSHCNRATRSSSQGRTVVDDQGIEAAGNRDLRSRGLCLVPLSCLSYVNTDGCGEGAWPPNDYGG